MSSYAIDQQRIPTGFDEAGLKIGLPRLPEEDLATYRLRLQAEAIEYGGPEAALVLASASRRVGLQSRHLFDIDLVLVDGEPVATDPYIEITSTRVRLYSDYGSGVPLLTIDLLDRVSGYFVEHVRTEIVANCSAYFTCTTNIADGERLHSSHLRAFTTEAVSDPLLLLSSRANNLNRKYCRGFFPSQPIAFLQQYPTKEEMLKPGDYCFDTIEGILWTYDTPRGAVTVHYRRFPQQVWWDPVKIQPLNDEDLQYSLYDSLIGQDGSDQFILLNPYGADVYNRVYREHPFCWTK